MILKSPYISTQNPKKKGKKWKEEGSREAEPKLL